LHQTVGPARGEQQLRTFADWNRPLPGFLEIDLVAHCGGSMWGSFVHSLVAADVYTGWTEVVSPLTREQNLVAAGLEAIARQLPFPVLGIDSDNDTVFINDTLTQYCAERSIEFTRSRAYRKNDQAWVEQKNGAVIRHEAVGTEAKLTLAEHRAALDPVALLHNIREAQSALAVIVSSELRPTPRGESLERFLAKLPDRWRDEYDSVGREPRVKPPRRWRTKSKPR